MDRDKRWLVVVPCSSLAEAETFQETLSRPSYVTLDVRPPRITVDVVLGWVCSGLLGGVVMFVFAVLSYCVTAVGTAWLFAPLVETLR